jgi:isopenicillin N synthase-like dioxygenase
MAFFCNVNGDAVVEPLTTCVDADHPAKYPLTTARDHLMAKHLASMGVKVETDDDSLTPQEEL